MGRYERNGILKPGEQEQLRDKKVCIVGLGGLGGYLAEMLGRIGVGHLTLIDGDVFVESNLNRQLLALTDTLGHSKAEAAKARLAEIDETLSVEAHQVYLDDQNAATLLKGHDLVIDALDQIPARLTLQEHCKSLNIPFVHGAIAGWYGQVTTILPGDDTLFYLYKGDRAKGVETVIGNPSFTPVCIASYQAAEAVKCLLGRGELLSKRVLCIDMFSAETEVITFE